MALGIGDGEEIAVGIIAELRHPIDGVGELGDPIQRIGGIDGLLAQRVDETPQPPRRIEHACGGPIQRIFHRDEITEFIGQGGDVVQRIFNRERLALGNLFLRLLKAR